MTEMNSKPKTHWTTCVRCGEPIYFNSGDILVTNDMSGAFPKMYTKNVFCPYCRERNIIEHKNKDGKVTKAIIEKL